MRLRRLDPRAQLPSRSNPPDAGYDLRSLEPGHIPAGGSAKVPTGLAIELPERVAGLVVPRSGLAAKHQITVTNAPGLIDPGYRGEIVILLTNLGEMTFVYEAQDRLAQLLFVHFYAPGLGFVEELSDSTRGNRGLGSSGVK